MHPSTGAWQRSFFVCCFAMYILGCGGVDPLVVKGRENEQLRYQNTRLRDSLIEQIGASTELTQEIANRQAVEVALEDANRKVSDELGVATAQIAGLTEERNLLTQDLRAAQKARETSEASLRRVQSVASDSAGELADLRVQSRDLRSELKRATERTSTLFEENSEMSRKLAAIEEELTRNRAVVRSLQAGGVVATQSPEGQLAEQKLRKENSDLLGANSVLEKRVHQLERKLQLGVAADLGAPVGPFYKENPQGLVDEFVILAETRYQKALAGDVAWDAFDIGFVAVAGVVALFFLLFLTRLGRSRRTKRELRNLRLAVQELEESAVDFDDEEAEAEERSRVRSSNQRTPRALPRRSGFSAVISSPTAAEASPQVEEVSSVAEVGVAEIDEDDAPAPSDSDPFERLLNTGEVQTPQEKGARKVIGARVWEEDVDRTVVAPVASASAVDDEDTEEASLAHTQIMPSFSEVELQGGLGPKQAKPRRAKASAAGAEDAGDKDLLNELKSVINKKFDELLK